MQRAGIRAQLSAKAKKVLANFKHPGRLGQDDLHDGMPKKRPNTSKMRVGPPRVKLAKKASHGTGFATEETRAPIPYVPVHVHLLGDIPPQKGEPNAEPFETDVGISPPRRGNPC